MGGSLDYRVYSTNDQNKIRKYWDDAVSQSEYEDGNSCSGAIGMLGTAIRWQDEKLASEDEAIEYLSEHHSKHDSAWAVSFYLPKKLTDKQKAKSKELETKYHQANKKHSQLRKDLITQFREGKSTLVSCKECNSKLSREHVKRLWYHEVRCPVCSTQMLSPTALDRINKSAERAEKLQKEWRESHKGKPSKEIGWVIGGVCSS